jgi:hypothetical protein
MKIDINTTTGFFAEKEGNSIDVQGMNMKNYVFDYAWDDLQGTIHGAQGTGKSGLTYEEYRDTGFNMDFFRHNQNDLLNMVYQMTHMWEPTTAIFPHIHVIPMTTGSGNVYFEYAYAWVPFSGILPASSSWIVGYISSSFSSDDQYKHKIISFNDGFQPPENAGASTMFLIKLTRLGTNILDTYSQNKDSGTISANLAILAADVHYQKIKAGTPNEY